VLNKIPTVINPQIPGEQPPADTPVPMREYLSRMFRYCSQSLRQIFEWQRFHLQLTPPGYAEDPHPQYWHKMLSSGFAGLHFQDLTTPKSIGPGDVVTNYTLKSISDWRLDSSLTAGTISIDPAEAGVFTLSVSGYAEGESNTTYVLTVYSNGVPSSVRMPIILRGTATSGVFSNSVVFALPSGTVDVRLEYSNPAGRSLSLFDVNFYVLRYMAIGGVTPEQNINGLPPAAPIPPGWGQPP
jgi:hypothetical protein